MKKHYFFIVVWELFFIPLSIFFVAITFYATTNIYRKTVSMGTVEDIIIGFILLFASLMGAGFAVWLASLPFQNKKEEQANEKEKFFIPKPVEPR